MPSIGALLKQEIRQLAARVSRSQGESPRRTVIAQRKQIAALEKQVANLHKGVKATTRATVLDHPVKPARPMKAPAIRALRARLGITASQLAKLVGVSDQSIYNWEHEKARPNAAPAAALYELKGFGKRQVRERLEKLS